MRRSFTKLFALLLVLGLVAAGCSKKSETTSESPSGSESSGTITINGDTANDHGEKSIGTETEVEVDDFYFSPTTIKAKAGTTVKLELANESSTLHNFSLDDQSIDTDVAAGAKVDVMVTVPASGSVEFYCKYHKSQGMVGQVSAA
jgi:plastocyanin